MIGVVRRATDVLPVLQAVPGSDRPHWILPGGRVEHGELLHVALRRELAEETRLHIDSHGRLAGVCDIRLDDPDWSGVWRAIAFDVPDCGGEPRSEDPDDKIEAVRFMPIDEARRELTADALPFSRPALAFLDGSAGHGSYWAWSAGLGFSNSVLESSDTVTAD